MIKSVMNMILSVGSNIKWMMKITLCLIPLNKIVDIKYTYEYLDQSMVQKDHMGGNHIFIYHRIAELL